MSDSADDDRGALARAVTLVERWLPQSAARRRFVFAALAGLLLFAVFQLGQVTALYGAAGEQGSPAALRTRIRALEQEGREAAEQLARLQTDARIDREAYAQVEQQLADLQGKIIEQQEELAFYRGVVGGPGQGGLRVQDFSLAALPSSAVRLKFVLTRVERAGQQVRGQVQVRVEGMRAERLVSLDLANLVAGGKDRSLSFDFRYFQDIEAELRVPQGFTPQRVVIRILPTTGGVKSSVESFPWSVQSP